MDIQLIMAYAENARLQLHRTLAEHTEAWERPIETQAQYKTIAQIAAHLVGAEERWTDGRLYGNPPATRYEEWAAKTLDELFADWDRLRARTLAFVQGADAETLARVITTQMPQWGAHVTLTLEDVLFHLVNHQTWHLGQVSMALQQMAIDPPNFDYVLLRGEPPV